LPASFNVQHTLKGTGDVVTTVQQEVQADKVTYDVAYVGDNPFFKSLKDANALAAFQATEYVAIEPMVQKLGFVADPPYWVPITSYAFSPVWNRKFYKKEIVSWNDTVDAELKDKAIQGDIRTSATQTDTYIRVSQDLPDYFQKYAEATNPVLIFRIADQLQKVTSGERVLTNFGDGGRSYQAFLADRDLDIGISYPTEGVVPLPVPVGVLAKAPHPNAARLFVEFLMSKEGQQAWLDLEGRWALRTDVSINPDLTKFLKPLDQIKTLSVDWEAMTSTVRDQARAEFRRIFKVS
jgi:iron(III) transport system substrate-binding protein